MLCGEISQNKKGKSKELSMEAMCHNPRERKSKSLDKGCLVERERAKSKKGKESKEKKENERKGKKGKGEVILPVFGLVYGKRGEEGKYSDKLYLISKIYSDRAVDFRRSKRQSSFT